MPNPGHDWISAARSLRSHAGATLLATGLLATGLAATAIALSLVDAYLLRPLPYPDSDRIVSVRWQAPNEESMAHAGASPDAFDGSSVDHMVDAAAAWDLDVFTILGGQGSELAYGAWVSPDYFRVLGVAPALGRPLLDSDLARVDGNVAVISHALWQRRFDGEPSAIGSSFEAYVSDRQGEAESFTIVGVMGDDFWPFLRYSEVLAPLRQPSFPSLARLREGVDPATASERLTTLVRAARGAAAPEASAPGELAPATEAGRVELTPLAERYVGPVRPLLVALLACALVLLIVVAGNVALLLTVVASKRERELAVRTVLGAGRGRLFRQIALEGVLIGLAACVVGLALTAMVSSPLEGLIESQLGREAPGIGDRLVLGPSTLIGVLVASLLVGTISGLLPALLLRDRDLVSSLRAGPAATESRPQRRARSALVGLEVALSLALLLAGGLATRSALRLARLDLGIDAGHVAAGAIGLRNHSYPDSPKRARFAQRLETMVATAPDVAAFAVGSLPPFGAVRDREIKSDSGPAGDAAVSRAVVRSISPSYLSALQVPLLEGRPFTTEDDSRAERVALVSQRLADQLWPGQSALDHRVRFAPLMGMESLDDLRAASEGWRVVGVVGNVRETLVEEDRAELYVPFAQNPSLWLSLTLRTYSNLGSTAPERALAPVRDALERLDRDAPVSAIGTLESRIATETERPRFLASVLAGFALFAVLLGLVGLYGVVTQSVLQRRRETAIRLALGARPRKVVGLFLGQALAIVGPSVVVGLLVGAALSRVLSDQLHGIESGDLLIWLVVPVLLTTSALLATWLPARRAASVDPALSLRSE